MSVLQVEMITGMVVMMHIQVVYRDLMVVVGGAEEEDVDEGRTIIHETRVEMEGLRMGKMGMVVFQVQKLKTHHGMLFLVLGLTLVAGVMLVVATAAAGEVVVAARECNHRPEEEPVLGGPVGGSL